MTYRYRCPRCGSFRGTSKEVRKHEVDRHRAQLESALHPIESYPSKEGVE